MNQSFDDTIMDTQDGNNHLSVVRLKRPHDAVSNDTVDFLLDNTSMQPPLKQRRLLLSDQSTAVVVTKPQKQIRHQPHRQPQQLLQIQQAQSQQYYSSPYETTSMFPVTTVEINDYNEHAQLKRLCCLLDCATPRVSADDPNSERRFVGLRTFLNYYFASNLEYYLPQHSVLRVFLYTSTFEIGARFCALEQNRYAMILLGNWDYWSTLTNIASALPNIYFSNDVNTTTEDKKSDNIDDDGDDDDDDEDDDNSAMDQAISALCLCHLFEMQASRDLLLRVPNYVSLAMFFARDRRAVNPFHVKCLIN